MHESTKQGAKAQEKQNPAAQPDLNSAAEPQNTAALTDEAAQKAAEKTSAAAAPAEDRAAAEPAADKAAPAEPAKEQEQAPAGESSQAQNLAAEAADLMAKAEDLAQKSAAETKAAKEAAAAEEQTSKNNPNPIQDQESTMVSMKNENTQSTPAPQQVIVKRGGAGLTIFCVLLAAAIAGVGFYGYQELQTLKAGQSALSQSNADLSAAQASLTEANARVSGLIAQNDKLSADNQALYQQNQALSAKLNELIAKQDETSQGVAAVYQRLDRYEARDPNEWRIAESYFNVAEAYRQAVFGGNIKAAMWNLQQADSLLANLQDKNIVAVREGIAKDLSALSGLPEIDVMGISLRLEQLYRDTDELVLSGYSDPEKRAHAFDKSTEPTSSFADWKNNLVNSAKEFSSRFVEIRRRSADAAVEFLSPQQELYLRENIKTRILLAKFNLAGGQQEQYSANLSEALRMVEAYFDKESTMVQAVINQLNSLKDQAVVPEIPRALESLRIFDKLAQEHLKNIQG